MTHVDLGSGMIQHITTSTYLKLVLSVQWNFGVTLLTGRTGSEHDASTALTSTVVPKKNGSRPQKGCRAVPRSWPPTSSRGPRVLKTAAGEPPVSRKGPDRAFVGPSWPFSPRPPPPGLSLQGLAGQMAAGLVEALQGPLNGTPDTIPASAVMLNCRSGSGRPLSQSWVVV